MRLSPVYQERTLRKAVRALKVSAIRTPIRRAKGRHLHICRPADIRAKVTSAASGRAGTVVVLRLHASGSECALAESWPTVRLHESAGADPVAKAIPDTSAFRATSRVLASYREADAQYTVLSLRSHHGASIALLASGRSSCRVLTSATIYPSAVALGAGLKVTLARPLRICGEPRILPFLPASGKALATVRGALAATESSASNVPSSQMVARHR